MRIADIRLRAIIWRQIWHEPHMVKVYETALGTNSWPQYLLKTAIPNLLYNIEYIFALFCCIVGKTKIYSRYMSKSWQDWAQLFASGLLTISKWILCTMYIIQPDIFTAPMWDMQVILLLSYPFYRWVHWSTVKIIDFFVVKYKVSGRAKNRI